MSFGMFIFLCRLMAMEKQIGLVHEEKIYDACKKFLLLNPDRVRNYFIGCYDFKVNEAIDLEIVLDLFWRY